MNKMSLLTWGDGVDRILCGRNRIASFERKYTVHNHEGRIRVSAPMPLWEIV